MGIDHLLRESQSPEPRFSPESAAAVALKHWAIAGTCQKLAGERDLNFCLEASDGSRHLLKIWNCAQDEAVIDFQLSALLHLEDRAPKLPVPRVVPTLGGHRRATASTDEGRHAVCLMTWLDGGFLREAPASPVLFDQLGASLARLDRALADFEHAASHRDMLWDLSRAHRLRPLLAAVPDPATARLAGLMLDRFESHALPALRALPQQVVHADFNLDNVLVGPDPDRQVRGIIDFGDALFAPRICDLAIASAYHVTADGHPLSHIRELVKGYNEALKLDEEEIIRLPYLIGARLVSSILITSHMASLHPENRDYLLIDTHSATASLGRLLGHDPDALAEYLASACS